MLDTMEQFALQEVSLSNRLRPSPFLDRPAGRVADLGALG